MTIMVKIGDCIVFPDAKGNYYGLILLTITQTVEYVNYSFLLLDQVFKETPALDDFLKAGLLGRKIPVGAELEEIMDGSYVKNKKFSLGYDTLGFHEENLMEELPKLIVLGNVSFSKIRFPKAGSFGYAANLTEVKLGIDYLRGRQKNGEVLFVNIKQEVFPIKAILGRGRDRAPKKIRKKWVLSKKTAHPHALKLLKEDFYWQTFDEFAPFGSDAGFDALHDFREWRLEHTTEDALKYVGVLEGLYAFTFPHLYSLHAESMEALKDKIIFLTAIDQGIIGACFAQLILEGQIDEPLQQVGLFALQRLLLKLANREEPWAAEGRKKLERQMEVLNSLFILPKG